jgi:hypothetical protein
MRWVATSVGNCAVGRGGVADRKPVLGEQYIQLMCERVAMAMV